MALTTDSTDIVNKLGKLIKGIRIAMMATATADGELRSRPMATQQTDFDGDLWFFTDSDSGKIYEIGRENHVNVSYADPSDKPLYLGFRHRINYSRL